MLHLVISQFPIIELAANFIRNILPAFKHCPFVKTGVKIRWFIATVVASVYDSFSIGTGRKIGIGIRRIRFYCGSKCSMDTNSISGSVGPQTYDGAQLSMSSTNQSVDD